MTEWVIILKGIQAGEPEITAAALRARVALQLPHTGAVTVQAYIYDEQTRLVRSTQPLSLVGSRSKPSPTAGTIEGDA